MNYEDYTRAMRQVMGEIENGVQKVCGLLHEIEELAKKQPAPYVPQTRPSVDNNVRELFSSAHAAVTGQPQAPRARPAPPGVTFPGPNTRQPLEWDSAAPVPTIAPAATHEPGRAPRREEPAHVAQPPLVDTSMRAPRREEPAAEPTQHPPKSVHIPEGVWTLVMSPEIITHGVGTIKPNFRDVAIWNEPLAAIPPSALVQMEWPTGFYRENQKSPMEFMFVGTDFIIRVSVKDRVANDAYILNKTSPNSGWVPLPERAMYDFPQNSFLSRLYRELVDFAAGK